MNDNRWTKPSVIFVGAILAIAIFLPCGQAQVSTAAINGTVRDATGAVIPGAKVVLHNTETGVERHVITNNAGDYALLNIPPGNYTLEASKAGFSTQKLAAFTLSVNQTTTLDFSLAVASVSQTINVKAQGVELQSSTSNLGQVVTQKEVGNLPLNGRNFTELLALTPGAAPISVSQNSGGSFLASKVGNFNFPAINGQTNRSNMFLLDGINDLEPFNSEYLVPPIIDDIQEFKVQSHNDQAKFGGVMGGTVNVVTKSGTNQLHGDAWEYVRNDAFDARSFFLPSVQPLRQNQFGATLGGPVVIPRIYNGHDRTFFFLAYQGYRFRQPSDRFYRVPTAANLAGDQSDWPSQIYNPFTTRPDPNKPGQFIRDPFPNNQIPKNLINPGAVLYAKTLLPAPIATGVGDFNAINSTPVDIGQEEYSARIDERLNDRNFLWFRYSGLTSGTTSAGAIQALRSIGDTSAKNWGLSWTHTFSSSGVLQAQLGRSLDTINTRNRFSSLPANFVQDVGWNPAWAGGFSGNVPIVPGFNVADYFSGFEEDYLNTPTQVWQGKGDYTKIYGRHMFEMGGELASSGLVSVFREAYTSFANAQTANPESVGNTGSPLASFLLNVPDSAERRNTLQQTRWGGEMGLYFSDQWKATSRLTMNMGLRYDRTFIPPYGKQIDIPGGMETGDMDFNNGTYIVQVMPPSCAERGHAPCIPGGVLPSNVVVSPNKKLLANSTKNFQPRFGLAYRLNSKTVVRTGFGVFFDNWSGVMQMTTNSFGLWPDIGILNALNLNYPSSLNPTPTVMGTNPIPQGVIPPPTPFNTVGWYFDPNLKNPYSEQWNFGVQRELTPGTVLDVNYVGSQSHRLDIGTYYNVAVTPGPGDPRLRQPYPYITPTYYDRSVGNGNYESLQFNLSRRPSHGLDYIVSYTWSKSMDEACSGWFGVEGCSNQDPYNLESQRSVSGFDLTHVLSISGDYQIPVGPGKAFHSGKRGLDYVLGNWQVNGIALVRSGVPYTVGVSGDVANTGNVGSGGYYERLNLVGNPHLSNPTPGEWFNTAAFAVPAQYTFGNVGRNALRSDHYTDVDFSLFRQFPIWEKKMLELRFEAFNVFNHPIFGTPVNNASSPNFGRVVSLANQPRILQFALKFFF